MVPATKLDSRDTSRRTAHHQKRSYQRPVLVTFGSVSELTKGGQGSLADGTHFKHQ